MLREFLRDLAATLRPADVADVLVVAVLVYLTIVWFRRARSRFVLGGFITLAALYVLARLLDMYLTLTIFQALITVALVAVVVIFQEDIRRVFERIAIQRRVRPSERGPVAAIDSVVEAVSQLANRKIGALLVFRGKEPLERHLSGGVTLDGRVSEPLLYSIFDPHSAGHDGAVVIEGDLVRCFGAHLPLSTRAPERFGTRHAAALGLAELSDALVVVVSEERGTISLARGGELTQVSAARLKSELEAFARKDALARPAPLYRRVLLENPGSKLIAFGVAATAWILLFGPQRETIAQTFAVPIVYREVPDGWQLDEPNPVEARITLTGRGRAFERLDPRALSISLGVAVLRPGIQRLNIDDADVERPRELAIHRIEPASVSVVAHRSDSVDLPVKPVLSGQLAPRLRLGSVRVKPERVRVSLRRSERGKVTSIGTEPVDLGSITASGSVMRSLRLPTGVRLSPEAPMQASVSIEVIPR